MPVRVGTGPVSISVLKGVDIKCQIKKHHDRSGGMRGERERRKRKGGRKEKFYILES